MCLMPFQQSSSYIMAVNFNSGETRVPVKNHQEGDSRARTTEINSK